MRAGNIDVWNDVDANSAKELKAGNPPIVILTTPNAGINMVLIQPQDELLSDVRIRKAIAMALDGATLRDELYEGYGSVGTSLVPTTSANYNDVEKVGIPYDPEGAKRLLKEAGYKGQPLVINTNAQFPIMKDTAILVQAMLKSVGLEARVNVMEFAAQMDRYYKGNFQLSIFNAVQYLDPVFSFDRYIGGPSASGDKVWRTTAANALLSRLFAAPDKAAKQAAFDDLHRQYLEDVPAAIWANRSTIAGVSSKVSGFAPWSGGKPRFWNVSLAP